MIRKIEDSKVHLIFDIGEYNADVIDFLTLLGTTSKSRITDDDVEELAEELKENWWRENKGRFVGENSN